MAGTYQLPITGNHKKVAIFTWMRIAFVNFINTFEHESHHGKKISLFSY